VTLPLLLMAGFMLFGLFSLWAWRAHAERGRGMASAAAANGLQFSYDDPFNSTRVPFKLFRLGDERQAQNVMWGRATDGAPVRVFDYSYWSVEEEHGTAAGFGLALGSDDGMTRRRTHSHRVLTCALTEVEAVWPHLIIQPEGLTGRVLDRLGLRDIEFESEEFNHAFEVVCEERRFASDFVDPQMMEFLLSTNGKCRFEIRGRWVLVATERVSPALAPSLIALSTELRERVPAVVWDVYPTLPSPA